MLVFEKEDYFPGIKRSLVRKKKKEESSIMEHCLAQNKSSINTS